MHLRSIWPNNTPSQKEISEPLFFKVLRTFRRSLVRQISEAVAIHGCMATVLLNSRSEWEQPMVDSGAEGAPRGAAGPGKGRREEEQGGGVEEEEASPRQLWWSGGRE